MTARSAAEVLAAMVAVFDSGDTDGVSDIVSEGYVDHQGLGRGAMRGVAGFLEVVTASRAGFAAKHVDILDLFGTGDRAVARVRWHGNRADGSELDRETIDIVRVAYGKAVEHWGAQC